MQLQPLTEEEKQMIRKAKRQANAYLKPLREEARRKYEFKPNLLEQALSELSFVTGTPARLYDKDSFQDILVDYDALCKFVRSLKDREWNVSAWINNIGGPALNVKYRQFHNPKNNGRLTLWGLPRHYAEVLKDTELPAIAI